MKLFEKILLACLPIFFISTSCVKDDFAGLILHEDNETAFRIRKSFFENIGSRDTKGSGRYDNLFFYFADENGVILKNIKSYYDSQTSQIRAEGLHTGHYILLVLGIDGNYREDGAVVNEILTEEETWLSFPETVDKPFSADYFYSRTPFSVEQVRGEDGKIQEVALIPDEIVQDRIISRIDFDFVYENQYVANSVTSRKVFLDKPKFYTCLYGNGGYGGCTVSGPDSINLAVVDKCKFLPLVDGTVMSGKIIMQTVNYLDEHIRQVYGFSIESTEPNKIHVMATHVNHPDDLSATMYLPVDAMTKGNYSKILQDDEPVEVYTDRRQRTFNTAEPLQVSITGESELHIRFYSPKDLHNVLIKARIPGVCDEYFDFAWFDVVPAFSDFYEITPMAGRISMVRTESGRYVEVRKLDSSDFQDIEFKIESSDDYWNKICQIKHGWTLYWGLFGGDPSKEDGAPVGNWMGIRPVHCRESVAFFLNYTYMIDMPEHEQILRENADKLYDDNKLPVKVEEVLAKMRRNQTLQVGLVYPGNGIIGLGSPSVYGAYQRGWFEHYFNRYACSVMFHELGHVMGYGHASAFTYGPWAEELMNNFYVDNLFRMPVDNISYLNSAENPNRYKN